MLRIHQPYAFLSFIRTERLNIHKAHSLASDISTELDNVQWHNHSQQLCVCVWLEIANTNWFTWVVGEEESWRLKDQ